MANAKHCFELTCVQYETHGPVAGMNYYYVNVLLWVPSPLTFMVVVHLNGHKYIYIFVSVQVHYNHESEGARNP